jgi:hypothetical protein
MTFSPMRIASREVRAPPWPRQTHPASADALRSLMLGFPVSLKSLARQLQLQLEVLNSLAQTSRLLRVTGAFDRIQQFMQSIKALTKVSPSAHDFLRGIRLADAAPSYVIPSGPHERLHRDAPRQGVDRRRDHARDTRAPVPDLATLPRRRSAHGAPAPLLEPHSRRLDRGPSLVGSSLVGRESSRLTAASHRCRSPLPLPGKRWSGLRSPPSRTVSRWCVDRPTFSYIAAR